LIFSICTFSSRFFVCTPLLFSNVGDTGFSIALSNFERDAIVFEFPKGKSLATRDIKIISSDDQFVKFAKAAYLETLVNGDEEGETTLGLVDRFLLLEDDPLSEGTRKEKRG